MKVQNDAAVIKLRAERRLGELLKETELNSGGGDRTSNHRSHDETGAPTLSDLGFTKSQSHRWQVSSEVPEEEFQDYVDTAVESEKEITSSGLYRLEKQLAFCWRFVQYPVIDTPLQGGFLPYFLAFNVVF